MFMRVMSHRGMPPRGSFQDRIAQEMLLRERRRDIATSIYQAQLVAAGLRIPGPLFDAWTMLYIDEITHDNYQPRVVKEKRRMLDAFDKKKVQERSHVARVEDYTVNTREDLRPYTPGELDKLRSKLRKRTLQNAQRGSK